MHIPKKFKQESIEELVSLIQLYPFASLLASKDNEVEIVHLPMHIKQVEDKFFLTGHIAKANGFWENIVDNASVLAIFNGPNCYVSPNFYPTKAEHGKAVPTWNYVVVHAKGKITFKHDVDWIYAHLGEMTAEHESGFENSWSITDAPKDYISKMLPAVVGIEIEVSSFEGQWKLSQNQPEVNRQGVVDGLSALEDPAAKNIAQLVSKYV